MVSLQRPELDWDDTAILAWRDRYLGDYNRKRRVRKISDESWKKANLWDWINHVPDAEANFAVREGNELHPLHASPLEKRVIEALRLEGRATSAGLREKLEGHHRRTVDSTLKDLLEMGVIQVVDRTHENRARVFAPTQRWEPV